VVAVAGSGRMRGDYTWRPSAAWVLLGSEAVVAVTLLHLRALLSSRARP
jgi:hypothetical protein